LDIDLKVTKNILCIDPGTTHSGVVVFNGKKIIKSYSAYENNRLLNYISSTKHSDHHYKLIIEGIESLGMSVGKTTFDTVEWIGRFRQEFGFSDTIKLYRREVKMFMCGSMRANDSTIRQRILDIYPAVGGGKTPQVGTKAMPGPLYGVSSHAWSALALGLTYKYGDYE